MNRHALPRLPNLRFLAALLLLLLPLVGCGIHRNTYKDGGWDAFSTFSSVGSPSITVVRTYSPTGELLGIQVFDGQSLLDTFAQPAGTAVAGYWIGEGLEESGDVTEVNATAEAEAAAEASQRQSIYNFD